MNIKHCLTPFLNIEKTSEHISSKTPQAEHHAAMLRILQEQCEKKGHLTVEEYMRLVLQHPRYGYYRQGNPLAETGDFSTLPETSQLFCEMVGICCVTAWERIGCPAEFALLELGPGQGTLLKRAFEFLSTATYFHKAKRLYLLESNETLREIQQHRLAEHTPTYIDKITDLPDLPIIMVANEFFDNLPLRQFVYRNDEWKERAITFRKDRFQFIEVETNETESSLATDCSDGAFYEESPASLDIVKNLLQHIKKHGGYAAIFDYGYNTPTGDSTLFSLKKHKVIDALTYPVCVDVTAEVNFGSFAKIAQEVGVETIGPSYQSFFLKRMGIDKRVAILKQHNPDQAYNIEQDRKRLLQPKQMGKWFKVMELCSKP